MSEVFKEIKELLTMQQVAAHFGFQPNRSGFIHSPFGKDRTASCKLYKNSFNDFSTGVGGDCIKFTALYLGTDNWNACKYLADVFSLPINLNGSVESKEAIRRSEAEVQERKERERHFKEALIITIERLKHKEAVCELVLREKLFPPLSDNQGFVIGELQKVRYKLDLLCMGTRSEQEAVLRARGWNL